MKNTLLLLLCVLATEWTSAQYKAVDQGSEVKFTISNFGFGVDGSFKGLQGNIDFDPRNAAAAHFDVSIDASTVNTDNNLRDSHLRNDSYFDVKNYPRIRIVSTSITPAGTAGTYQFTGQLTIRNTTKEISFPFTVSVMGEGAASPAGGSLNLKGSFVIRRKDFGVGGASTISNELTVSLNVIATK
ncbi:MAG TPA: YceI family protein [Puia sp.]|jgi:polyisoprenoid-binding protein YceI|nr:YceI family protein [Puia sp.]